MDVTCPICKRGIVRVRWTEISYSKEPVRTDDGLIVDPPMDIDHEGLDLMYTIRHFVCDRCNHHWGYLEVLQEDIDDARSQASCRT